MPQSTDHMILITLPLVMFYHIICWLGYLMVKLCTKQKCLGSIWVYRLIMGCIHLYFYSVFTKSGPTKYNGVAFEILRKHHWNFYNGT